MSVSERKKFQLDRIEDATADMGQGHFLVQQLALGCAHCSPMGVVERPCKYRRYGSKTLPPWGKSPLTSSHAIPGITHPTQCLVTLEQGLNEAEQFINVVVMLIRSLLQVIGQREKAESELQSDPSGRYGNECEIVMSFAVWAALNDHY